MYLTSYFTSPNQPQLLAQLRACEWGAAKFLTELLEKEQFHHTLGAGDCYFLMAGDQIAAFATLTDRDCVDAPELRPWCGFVYTFPAYRHQRIAGKLLHELAEIAQQNGENRVYIATDHANVYEKYGCTYLDSRYRNPRTYRTSGGVPGGFCRPLRPSRSTSFRWHRRGFYASGTARPRRRYGQYVRG